MGEEKSLYESAETRKTLLKGLKDDVGCIYNIYVRLLNLHFDNYVIYYFDSQKSEALFANAKEMADKREEMLLKAVRYKPWDHGVVSFIFINYDKERKSVLELANRCGVDLSKDTEDVLKKLFDSAPKETVEDLLKLKDKLHSFMLEYNIGSSEIVDSLDNKLLKRLLEQAELSTVSQCDKLKKAIEAYKARDEIKAPFLKDIQDRKNEIWDGGLEKLCDGYKEADEARCNEFLSMIEAFDAPKERKEIFAERVKDRINEILSDQDEEIFGKIYMDTDLHKQSSVKAALDSIRKKKRTAIADRYLEALDACSNNSEDLKQAISYLNNSMVWLCGPIIFSATAVLLFVGKLIVSDNGSLPIWLSDLAPYLAKWRLELSGSLPIWLGIVLLIGAFYCFCILSSMHMAVLKLTIDGKHLHPSLFKNPKRTVKSVDKDDVDVIYSGCGCNCLGLVWLALLIYYFFF